MLCTWGDITFDAGHIISISEDGGATYAEHALIGRKPKLQYTGDSLRTYELSINLHWLRSGPKQIYANSPAMLLSALNTAVAAHKPLPFSWGDGTYEGVFVGDSISLEREETTPDGRLLAATYTLTLKEFADNNTPNAKAPAVKATGTTANPSTAQTQANSGKVSGQKPTQGKATTPSQVVRQKGG